MTQQQITDTALVLFCVALTAVLGILACDNIAKSWGPSQVMTTEEYSAQVQEAKLRENK